MSDEIKTAVVVSLQVEGTHSWPDCPIPEVDFLKHPHRHMFHINAQKLVTHDDRDVEIIQLKRAILDYFGVQPVDFRNLSCEMIARRLMESFKLCACSVMEDGENGAHLWRHIP